MQGDTGPVGVGASFLLLAIVAVIAGAVYFAPALNASSRKHPQVAPIFAVNLLLGWTLVGWVAALVWSMLEVEAKPSADQLKGCPDCAERVQRAARKCRFCGFEFPEAEAAIEPPEPEPEIW